MSDSRPFFAHPSTKENVYVIFDACHMLKLMRNCLGDIKVFKDSDGNLIQWKYITAALLQEKEGLRTGNKIRISHIAYHKIKMKVSLAAQTLSDSVADAIEFCAQKLQLYDFQGSEATVKFIRCINVLFDFLNSRNPYAKGFKSPLRRNTEEYWRPTILHALEYLKGISNLEDKAMFLSPRRVLFVGLITGNVCSCHF